MSKNGKYGDKQKFKCHVCGKQFYQRLGLNPENIYREYVFEKQTLVQLSVRHSVSVKTIQRKLDLYEAPKSTISNMDLVLLMDTTYWKRSDGMMLYRDALNKVNVLRYYIKNETIKKYTEGIDEIKIKGHNIKAIVCDGRPGLIKYLISEGYIVQLCQFHQLQIVRRYLTKNPKMEASKELWNIAETLTKSSNSEFKMKLDSWYKKWKDFYNERSTNPVNNKSYYTHKKLRSAYRSLTKNISYIFTFEEYPELNIPNTTNGIDGVFADLKNKLRNHNGLTKKEKRNL